MSAGGGRPEADPVFLAGVRRAGALPPMTQETAARLVPLICAAVRQADEPERGAA